MGAFVCCIGYVVCKFSRLLINSGKQFKIIVWCVLDNGGSDLRKLVKIDMLNWNMIIFIFYLCFMIHCLDDYCYDTGISTNINLDICFSYIFSHRKRSIQRKSFLLIARWLLESYHWFFSLLCDWDFHRVTRNHSHKK